MELISKNEKETYNFAIEFAKTLKPFDIVALDGDLGVGKTVFVKGVCDYFKVSEYVNSPSYTIVNEYTSGTIKINHFDIYRISYEDELLEIGFHEYLKNGSITIVEWAINAPEIFSELQPIHVSIERTSNDFDERLIKIEERAVNK